MDYEGQICRAPMERSAFMLPVAVGCSHNACKFCMLFKHLHYRRLPMEQIRQEILRVKNLGGNPEKVYFGDGNAFSLSAEELLAILDMVHEHFPGCKQINMDSTVTNIAEKTDDELRKLKAAGVKCLYLGIESGLDEVLSFMHKDHSLAEAYEQIARLHEFGFTYGAHIMTGIAGKGSGLKNAAATAEFLNATKPCHVINFSVFYHHKSPLYKDIEKGLYAPADEVETLREEQRLLELLDIPGVKYDGFHDLIGLRFRGTLPQDKEVMLNAVAAAVAKQEEQAPVIAWTDACPYVPVC